MRNIYLKLMASLLSVLVACSMIIGVSYAWVTLSNSPAVSGIQVSIGGGNTILLAPDVTEIITDENGNEVLVHYPGAFDDTLNLFGHESYGYLEDLAGLSPVSTADGIYWMLPVYEEGSGKLKDVREFTVDSRLENANAIKEGSGAYAYLDFWVVSPGSEYDLRVSMDSKTGAGSFLVELPEAEETPEGQLQLSDTYGHVASIARVGFLANAQVGSDWGMEQYSLSENYDKRFQKLLGVYQEPGELPDLTYEQRFTIYEPNGLLHPDLPGQDGSYLVTRPLIFDETLGKIGEAEVSHMLSVQQNSALTTLGEELWLEDIFQASIAGKENLTAEAATAAFYNDYLNGQIAPYVSAGTFFTNTAVLYSEASLNGGTIGAEDLDQKFPGAGATEDVIITGLERNVPQRIRMFIWLEGQDADCINIRSVESAGFTLGIELSGATK